MKEITVVSGKGGTGKTSVTAAIAAIGKNMVFCDGDVDAPDLHLILQPDIKESFVFEGGWEAEIDVKACTSCGLCMDYCRFDAIRINGSGQYAIDLLKCEGCRLCERICPSEAISSKRRKDNQWFISGTRLGTMVHARMGPGQENSGKLVTLVRRKAAELALDEGNEYLLTDGPPGIGCPAIASITGASAVLVVIEPSQTSIHDAARVIELANGFEIPVYALINKYDIHPSMADRIEKYLEELNVPLLGKIPFSNEIVDAMIAGKSIVEYAPESETAVIISEAWKLLRDSLEGSVTPK